MYTARTHCGVFTLRSYICWTYLTRKSQCSAQCQHRYFKAGNPCGLQVKDAKSGEAEIQRRTAAQLTGRSRTNPISLRRDPESLDQRGETSWSVVIVVVVVAAAVVVAVFQRVLKMF